MKTLEGGTLVEVLCATVIFMSIFGVMMHCLKIGLTDMNKENSHTDIVAAIKIAENMDGNNSEYIYEESEVPTKVLEARHYKIVVDRVFFDVLTIE